MYLFISTITNGNFQKAPWFSNTLAKLCSCALETYVAAFSTLLSAGHHLSYNSTIYHFFRESFPESTLCSLLCAPLSNPCPPYLSTDYTILPFCLLGSTVLNTRQKGPLPYMTQSGPYALYVKDPTMALCCPFQVILHVTKLPKFQNSLLKRC